VRQVFVELKCKHEYKIIRAVTKETNKKRVTTLASFIGLTDFYVA